MLTLRFSTDNSVCFIALITVRSLKVKIYMKGSFDIKLIKTASSYKNELAFTRRMFIYAMNKEMFSQI